MRKEEELNTSANTVGELCVCRHLYLYTNLLIYSSKYIHVMFTHTHAKTSCGKYENSNLQQR
jgi:hypothetical protein